MTIEGGTVTAQLTEDARRTAILDAAAQLIAERGYHSVRISDIAQVVGTSTGAVHYYFPRQERRPHGGPPPRHRQRVRPAESRTQGDRQRPRATAPPDRHAVAPRRTAARRVVHLAAVLGRGHASTELRPFHNTYYARWHETVVKIVRRGQRQEIFRTDVDPETIAQRLTALTDGTAIQVLTGAPNMTVAAMKEVLVQFVHDELVAPRTW